MLTNNLDERSKQDFLVYANSVIKSRAIPSIEDNLKPIHRKVLYTLWEDKVFSDKPTKKCATEAGRVLAYSPHGDASVYGAMVRLAQWWKLRYPLIEMQGNCGNLLGDGAAASRYTECRLSPIGMLMLEGLNKNAVDFKPNYDETTIEPVTLPSKFPYLLCGNNSGIAVGMSSDLVSHNFTEVMGAINHYIDNPECSIADLMQFIQGPDFPTGGVIMNGEELLEVYSRGYGSVRIQAHYDIAKKGNKTLITFHDLPYGVEIDGGVKAPLKKLVLEDGYEVFENIDVKKVGPRNFDITITLGKNADVKNCLNILFTKTRLAETIKINQTLIVNGEPKVLNLKELIAYWVNYRSSIIKRMTQQDYDKTNHKLTVTIGLQKCMSDIDQLIDLIRGSNSRADAKVKIMKAFVLNDEQADAVLDMKLSKLSRLDLEELNTDEKELTETLAKLKVILENERERWLIIKKDLKEIKDLLGEDKRITEVVYTRPLDEVSGATPVVKKEWFVYPEGVVPADGQLAVANTKNIQNNLLQVVFAYTSEDIFGFTRAGELVPHNKLNEETIAGAFVKSKANKLVTVTKNGNIKVSMASEYKWNKVEKLLKVKEDDELIYAGLADDLDYVILFDGQDKVLKLKVSDLTVASKMTLGVKSGFTNVSSAAIVKDSDLLLCVTADNKGKFTAVKDFSVDNRGNKGQSIAENTVIITPFDDSREDIYITFAGNAKPMMVKRDKLSIKSKTAAGATLTAKNIKKVV